MATVRINSTWGHPNQMKWCGAPAIDHDNHIERSLPIPEIAYRRIEAAIGQGYPEGNVNLPDGSRFEWFLDRSPGPGLELREELRAGTGAEAPRLPEARPPREVAPRSSCPDCGTRLEAIQIIDRSNEPDQELQYAAGDAPRGWILGRFPILGRVRARLCPACGRIVLHAEPYVRSS